MGLVEQKLDSLGYVKRNVYFVNDMDCMDLLKSKMGLGSYLEAARELNDKKRNLNKK